MRRWTHRGAVLVIVLAGVAAGWTAPPLAVAEVEASATVDCRPLTRRQRVAQTVMTGIPSTRMTDRTKRLVTRHAGTVVLMGHNVADADQVLRLTRALRRNAPKRMLVAVDEEGGRVARLGQKGIVTHIPSARTLARTRTADEIRRIGRRLGKQMLAVGVDWNLAPVLDVADADRNTVIGDRSYSGDPAIVARAGGAFARGLRSAGVKTTGKHFPGHGRTTVDSHETLPTITASLSQLLRRDVRPFKETLPALDSVMSAHVRYTALDKSKPASLSRAATRLLRERLGYNGLLITDALEMGAITSQRSIPQAAEQALRAGADVLLVGDFRATGRVTDRVAGAVRRGRVSAARLDAAAARVLKAKGYGAARVGCLLRR